MLEPFTTTRQANKEKRRCRILAAARQLLTERGFEGLNSRDLAKAAGVTTPTLYNLVGNKAEVLTTLALEGVDHLEETLDQINRDDALSFIEGIVEESIQSIGADPEFARGSMIALYEVSSQMSAQDQRDTPEQHNARRCIQVAIHGCQSARKQGLLTGNVPVEWLGDQMYAAFSKPWREWVYRRLSLADFRLHALRGFYMCLCSDASPEFLIVLRAKLQAIQTTPTANNPPGNPNTQRNRA